MNTNETSYLPWLCCNYSCRRTRSWRNASYFNQNFGNAASRYHAFGWLADDAVQVSMDRISKAINCKNSDIIFTSGATESINLAIKGYFDANPDKTHFITISTEHKATLDTIK